MFTDLRELRDGTRFEVINGRWTGSIFSKDEKKYMHVDATNRDVPLNGSEQLSISILYTPPEPDGLLSDRIAVKAATVGKTINADDYRFLDKIAETHKPIIIGFGGSHAYGTNIETSDTDIRGIAMNTADEVLLGKDYEQFVDEKTDTTIYSFLKMVKLLTECNPNTIEILGLRPEHYLYKSELGEYILLNSQMFLSQRCFATFGGYAEQQMYRLRQKTLAAIPEEELNKHISKVMNSMLVQLRDQYNIKDVETSVVDGKIVCSVNVKDYPMEDLSSVLGVINRTLTDYRKRSVRNDKAMTHGKIAKHSMHLLRLYMMAEDLLLDGKIVTYRSKEHDLLMKIRNGDYLDENGQPNKEFFEIVDSYKARFEHAKAHSILPEKPDMDKINGFITSVLTDMIKKG
jgi:predicted nucleotidyltransferase